jgi:hypothetical protein
MRSSTILLELRASSAPVGAVAIPPVQSFYGNQGATSLPTTANKREHRKQDASAAMKLARVFH